MLDFTEKEVSTTLQPALSADTQTVSVSPPGTEFHIPVEPFRTQHNLADPATTAATLAALDAPARDLTVPWEYVQNEKED